MRRQKIRKIQALRISPIFSPKWMTIVTLAVPLCHFWIKPFWWTLGGAISWLESRWEVSKHSIWYASIFMPYWLKNQRGPQYSFRTPKYFHFFNTSTSPSPAQVVECLSVGNCIQYLRIVENVLPSLILLDAMASGCYPNLRTKTLAKLQLQSTVEVMMPGINGLDFLTLDQLIGSPRAPRNCFGVDPWIPGIPGIPGQPKVCQNCSNQLLKRLVKR